MSGVPMKVRGDIKEVTRHLDKTARKTVPGAAVSSLTGTTREIRQEALRWARDRLGVPAREINKRARILRATRQRWRSTIYVNPLDLHPARVMKSVRQTRSGVRAGRHSYPGHFVTGGITGPIVAARVGAARLPIKVARIDMEPVLRRFQRITKTRGFRIFQKKFRETMKRALSRRGFNAAAEMIR